MANYSRFFDTFSLLMLEAIILDGDQSLSRVMDFGESYADIENLIIF